MKITYDREVDALYIRFKETTVTTKHVDDGIALDYDAAHRLAGIEILDAALDNPVTPGQPRSAQARRSRNRLFTLHAGKSMGSRV